MRHFEDFVTGSTASCGTLAVSDMDILHFARAFDPQDMHLDPRSAQAKSVGGLIASGWQTCGFNMRLMAAGFLNQSAAMGAPGVESVRWLRPVRPGDILESRYTVLGRRGSVSKPDRGFVRFRHDVSNQQGEKVLEQMNFIMFARRTPGAAIPDELAAPVPSPPEVLVHLPEEANAPLEPADRLRPGMTLNLGAYDFVAEEMIDFARLYDPQPFHLSEEAGRASHFGGLAASGWHTAAAWMKRLVTHRHSEGRAGRPVPKLGPSPGFRDLIWRRPVLAGDRITYFSRVIESRLSASRPGWGVVSHRNYGLNRKGEVVFAFTGTVLWEAGT